ncbi:hypothetical protein [Hasllibacter sp. MH4015]|uniref:hypothetical protein n=1 Tax=Hasllibacter sp. MH4015 TaxID=2854029 RepID=UPI001CD3BB92|nr:hypothetical protein [Hasllibacter sp. MH4015]
MQIHRPLLTFIGLSVLGLIFIAAVTASARFAPLLVGEDGLLLMRAFNIVVLLLLVSFIIERACEGMLGALTDIGLIPAKSEGPQAQSRRNLVSFLICLTIASLIVVNGIFLGEMVLTGLAGDIGGAQPATWFRFVDAALTSLVLVGGAQGIHRLLKHGASLVPVRGAP